MHNFSKVYLFYVIESKKQDVDKICQGVASNSWVSGLLELYPDTICGGDPTYRFKDCNPSGLGTDYCLGAINIQGCTIDEQRNIYLNGYPQQSFVNLAKYLEEVEECAGICRKCPHYMYTGCKIHRDKSKTCTDAIIDILKSIVIE